MTTTTTGQTAADIAAALASGLSEGGTYRATYDGRYAPADHADGYYVGGATYTAMAPVRAEARVRRAVDAVAETYAADYVGTWLEDGVVYVDGVDHVADRDAALAIARARGERAVWDVAAGATVYVNVVA